MQGDASACSGEMRGPPDRAKARTGHRVRPWMRHWGPRGGGGLFLDFVPVVRTHSPTAQQQVRSEDLGAQACGGGAGAVGPAPAGSSRDSSVLPGAAPSAAQTTAFPQQRTRRGHLSRDRSCPSHPRESKRTPERSRDVKISPDDHRHRLPPQRDSRPAIDDGLHTQPRAPQHRLPPPRMSGQATSAGAGGGPGPPSHHRPPRPERAAAGRGGSATTTQRLLPLLLCVLCWLHTAGPGEAHAQRQPVPARAGGWGAVTHATEALGGTADCQTGGDRRGQRGGSGRIRPGWHPGPCTASQPEHGAGGKASAGGPAVRSVTLCCEPQQQGRVPDGAAMHVPRPRGSGMPAPACIRRSLGLGCCCCRGGGASDVRRAAVLPAATCMTLGPEISRSMALLSCVDPVLTLCGAAAAPCTCR